MTNKGTFCEGGCGRKKTQTNRHYAPGCGYFSCVSYGPSEMKLRRARRKKTKPIRWTWWEQNKPVEVAA